MNPILGGAGGGVGALALAPPGDLAAAPVDFLATLRQAVGRGSRSPRPPSGRATTGTETDTPRPLAASWKRL